jgi:hypothetical protein
MAALSSQRSYVFSCVGVLVIASWLAPIVIGAQTYSQYLDAETCVIKRPEGDGWSDPFGDSVWRSSWFYASLIVLKEEDAKLYDSITKEHGISTDHAKQYLENFRNNNLGDEEWSLPKNPSQKFSRDQLIPLLYLLAAVRKYEPDMKSTAKGVLEDLMRIVSRHGGVSDSNQGEVRENLKYVIDVLARKYRLDSVDGNTRSVYKAAFTLSLKADSGQVQLPGDAATHDDFSVFNRLALVTLQGLMWGNDDDDVKKWRRHYRQHADKGWGPAFRIVAGRSLPDKEISKYKSAFIKRSQDNDIIMAQRPHTYLSGEFPDPQFKQDESNGSLVLDYVVLAALDAAWD